MHQAQSVGKDSFVPVLVRYIYSSRKHTRLSIYCLCCLQRFLHLSIQASDFCAFCSHVLS